MPLSSILSPQRNCFVSFNIFCDLTKRNFRFPFLMGARTNRKLDAASVQLSCVNSCRFLQCENEPSQLVCLQAVTLDTTNQLCCIIKNSENDCCEGARKLVDERTKE